MVVLYTVFVTAFFVINRMKPRKVKEDDAPRTIACPHKVSLNMFRKMWHLKRGKGFSVNCCKNVFCNVYI